MVDYTKTLETSPEIAQLIGVIHEGLPPELAKAWPERIIRALQPGADTTLAWPEFAVWLLTEVAPSPEGEEVAELYRRRIAGDEPAADEWTRAKKAAQEVVKAYNQTRSRAACRVAGCAVLAIEAPSLVSYWATRSLVSWVELANKLEKILRACPTSDRNDRDVREL